MKLMPVSAELSYNPIRTYGEIIGGSSTLEITLVGDPEAMSGLYDSIHTSWDDIENYLPSGKVIVKCKHCGQWCARKTACRYCGAPVD